MVTMAIDTNIKTGKDLEVYFGEWLSEHGRNRATAASYQQGVRMFQRWFQETNGVELRLELLNSWDMRAWREYSLNVDGVKPATWNLRRASLMVLCQYARDLGAIENDPSKGLALAREERQSPHWLDDKEFGRVMRQVEIEISSANTEQRKVRALRDRALVMLLVFAGLREAEAASLFIEDLHISERKGLVTIRRGKGDKRREVPLNSEVRKALGEYLVECSSYGPLFDMGIRAIQKRMEAIGKAAGVEGLMPHRLRHTCAKRMVDAGVHLTVVQKVLGHSKIETTCRYTQPGWEDMAAGVESIGLGRMSRK